MDTAVLLAVPEAEPLVHDWRGAGDPSAAHGVPAHVTLLHPFLPSAQVDAGVLAELKWFFQGVDAFDVAFDKVGRFEGEGVVYLAPSGPALTELSRALCRRWPECPPYAGAIPVDDVIAHLTIVRTDDRGLRQRAGDAVSPQLPLVARIATASLWACDDDGEWSQQQTFALGEGD